MGNGQDGALHKFPKLNQSAASFLHIMHVLSDGLANELVHLVVDVGCSFIHNHHSRPLQDCSSHAQQLFFSRREVVPILGYGGLQVTEDVGICVLSDNLWTCLI